MISFFAQIAHWLELHAMPCLYKKYFGVDCPGCGMQRAVIELFKGDIFKSLQYYPACIPLFIMIIFLVMHIYFKYKQGARILQWMFTINTTIIFFNYIYKQF